jgi:hypothetical protein
MKLPKECPQCGCPFWEQNRTTDGETKAWKNEGRDWYAGPLTETAIIRCASKTCGWSFSTKKSHGKLEETDYFAKLKGLLAGWVAPEILDHVFSSGPGLELAQAEIDRIKGVLEIRLRVVMTPPEPAKGSSPEEDV